MPRLSSSYIPPLGSTISGNKKWPPAFVQPETAFPRSIRKHRRKPRVHILTPTLIVRWFSSTQRRWRWTFACSPSTARGRSWGWMTSSASQERTQRWCVCRHRAWNSTLCGGSVVVDDEAWFLLLSSYDRCGSASSFSPRVKTNGNSCRACQAKWSEGRRFGWLYVVNLSVSSRLTGRGNTSFRAVINPRKY